MKFILSILIYFLIFSIQAQIKLDDYGRIVINTYIPENAAIPSEAKNALVIKLNQVTTNNGIGGAESNPRFIISAKFNLATKDIISGPPQLIAQNIDITLFIGDALQQTIFSNINLSLRGVGINENKAFIDAIKLINPKNKEFSSFIEEAKFKIINYYKTQCDFIIKDAKSLVKQEKYDEAIYQLSLIPEVCEDCFFKSLDVLNEIHQEKIEIECKLKLNNAKAIWSKEQNTIGAEKTIEILTNISPIASCQPEVKLLITSIEKKLKDDENVQWQFKMKQYADKVTIEKEMLRIAEEKSLRDDQFRDNQAKRNFDLYKLRIKSYREIALEYVKNQPKTINYSTIYWR